ncbi:hypothetical protein [Prauserella endophytica]|uniref:EF-hand domain-containing protein n=1 Tax=Prauserella endophytica TaxID=1592324 RepID=A0ABY2S075_9PSEU|nr:hypothetical protein [Prauserella endophytica]TKG67040.1 hypothetical protein FCN18_24350 [Prauserella endophytica]
MIATYRHLGITDECVTCEACGKPNLRSTVVLGILDTDGNVEGTVYYGSSCAARALGARSSRDVLARARAAHRKTVAAADLARDFFTRYDLPEDGTITTKELIKAACKIAPDNRHVCVDYDSSIETTMDLIALHRRALADANLISGESR